MTRLLDSQTADRPRDHELLDLLGALEDVVDLPEWSIQYHADSLTCGYPVLVLACAATFFAVVGME